MVCSDRYELDLSDETIRIQNFYFNQKLRIKTAENDRNDYVAKKRIVSKLSKTSIQILITQIEDFNKDCFQISGSYLTYSPRNKPPKSVIVESCRFIVLNDSASPKMVIKIYFNFFRFCKGFKTV